MDKSIYSKPLIQKGWLRVVLFITVLILFYYFAVLFYGIWLHGQGNAIQAIQELLKGTLSPGFELLLFILVILLIFIFRRWIDRKSFISLGLSINGYLREAAAGSMLAVSIVGASSLILKISGSLKWMDIIFDARALFLSFGTIFITAFYEELIFRGYILSNLLDSFSKWAALAISALLFMISNWNDNGFFPLINTLIVGLILGLNFLYTRNIWFCVFFHAGWKFLEGPLLGFPGQHLTQTLLQPDLNGNENVTGGASGLEGSFIFMFISLLGLLALYVLIHKKFNLKSPPVPNQI